MIGDVLIGDGRVVRVEANIATPENAQVIDAERMVVSPGFIDLHCHLRDPGLEYKETIASGTRAAAKGGFTTVCAMPNTEPTMHTRATVEYVMEKARTEGAVRVLPIGCVTKRSAGAELAEMAELAEAGCIGFSDDGHPVVDSNIMRQALSYASGLGLPIINHCETPDLFRDGHMNEGWVSNRLGIQGAPNSAEETMVARDIMLAELTGGHIHLAHISTERTLDLVRSAKERGVRVTCEITPHHLTLTDEAVMGNAGGHPFDALETAAYDTYAKVNPPLRARSDMEIMAAGLCDGTIDVIATDHAPHNQIEKLCTFEEAAMGISNLETALGSVMSLVHAGQVGLPLMIEKLTSAPAEFLGRTDIGSLKPGANADVTIFDPNAKWTVDVDAFESKGKNSPLHGQTLHGQVSMTLVGGKVVYSNGHAS
ncbi:MAG: dihydroorotase [Dehalococcoidia bacterium]|nr:dihydroorotase [Dehalococcoidia bacterium]